jgi:two-component system cell cycle sensor histidine kinase/response regulator CckA
VSVSDFGSGDILAIVRDASERRALEEQLRQAQKMDAVGRLAAGVSHDYNNVLTVIAGYAELLAESLDPDDPRHRDAEEIQKAAAQAAGITHQLLAFSRKQVLHPQVVDVCALVADMERLLRRLIREDITFLVRRRDQPAFARVDPAQIHQVIVNLVINARDAMPDGGRLLIETSSVAHTGDHPHHAGVPPGSYVVVSVTDTGVGMDEETRQHVFEPFFTTKPVGRGTGLGLPMVYGIVRQSGGHVVLSSEPGLGTTVQVFLPHVAEGRPVASGAPAITNDLDGTEDVLIVEDDTAVRGLLETGMRRHGYRVTSFASGEEAIRRIEQGYVPEVLVTDVVMSGINGRVLADRIRAMHASVKVLFVSGYTDDAIIHAGPVESGAEFLQKPFGPDELAQRVRRLLSPPD